MINATLISKEEISAHKFRHGEVLTTAESMIQRRIDIERAMRLGNNDHNKVKIIFETEDGIMQVETTIWSATQNYVMLKANIQVPISCIHRIEFYE